MFDAIENKLIFFPARFPAGDWHPSDLQFEDVHFTTADQVHLHGWYCPCPEGISDRITLASTGRRPVVLYSHGNAGNLSIRANNIRLWRNALGVDVFIYDYRGYGKSEGEPSEQGLYLDSRAAYAWLVQTRGVDADRIVLYGRSLGGAVSLELALEAPHRALILESTFTSLPDIAQSLYPMLPVKRFMRTQFSNSDRITRYGRPVLIVHGLRDSLVNVEHARTLYRLAREPKTLVEIPHADHNDVSLVGGAPYFDRVGAFLRQCFASPAGSGTSPATSQ